MQQFFIEIGMRGFENRVYTRSLVYICVVSLLYTVFVKSVVNSILRQMKKLPTVLHCSEGKVGERLLMQSSCYRKSLITLLWCCVHQNHIGSRKHVSTGNVIKMLIGNLSQRHCLSPQLTYPTPRDSKLTWSRYVHRFPEQQLPRPYCSRDCVFLSIACSISRLGLEYVRR